MQITQNNIDSNTIKFEIVASKEKLEPNLQKSYFKNVKNIIIPGFRKGRVPRNILERYYGKDVLYNDALNLLLPSLYKEIIEENKFDPVAHPECNVQKINNDGSVEIEIIVYNKPKFDLQDYKNYDLKLKDIIITNEEIQEVINKELEGSAMMIPSENLAKIGDSINFNFEGFLDGVPFEGGKAENCELILGNKQFIEGFEDNLLNHNVDDEFEFNIKFPENYHVLNLAGQETTFKIKINSIKEKKLPNFDADFVQSISSYQIVEDYIVNLKEKIVEKQSIQNIRDLQDEIVTKLIEDNVIEIPKIMIKNHIDDNINQLSANLQKNKYTLQQYLDHNNMNLEQLREKMEPEAIANIKISLMIEKIAQLENIEVLPEEFTKKAREVINKYEFDTNQLNQELITEIKKNILHEKTIEFLSNLYIDNIDKPIVV